jgi:hypothetical protein
MKLFIRIRKALWLPIKWFAKRRLRALHYDVLKPLAVMDKILETQDELLRAERVEDPYKIKFYQGKLSALNEILYAKD